MRSRHLNVFIAFAKDAAARMTGPRQARALTEVAIEEDNILSALSWCDHAEGGAEAGLRLASEATRYWSLSGRYSVGRQVMLDALARDKEARPTPLRALTLTRFAGFAVTVGDYENARPALEQSLALCIELDDRKGVARAYAGLAVVAMMQERYDDALVTGAESMSRYESLGEQRGVAMALHNLGTVHALQQNDAAALASFTRARDIVRTLGDQSTEVLVSTALAATHVRMGDLAAARLCLVSAFDLLEALGLPREGVFAVESAAELLMAGGRAEPSVRLMGAAQAARAALGTPQMPYEQREFDSLAQRIEAALGAADAARRRAEGSTLTLTQATAEASALIRALPTS